MIKADDVIKHLNKDKGLEQKIMDDLAKKLNAIKNKKKRERKKK